MNDSSGNQTQPPRAENENASTFESIFFVGGNAMPVRVPDYQRAYAWEQKQIELFLADLLKYQADGKRYYFGHFIAEDIIERWEIVDGQQRITKCWEIVDGQQRITTFVLFLMVCRVLSESGAHATAFSMIQQFTTVSYDAAALKTIGCNLKAFLEKNGHFDERKPPSDEQIIKDLSLEGSFTRSQRRMVLALLRFHQAFQKGKLEVEKIGGYIDAVMAAHCSCHLTKDKSVAVNIFEMHNTRGIPLTTLEIIKAMLMKFVYDHGGSKVAEIQKEFGEVYGMEESVAGLSFRGEMTMEQLLRLHLRVVDDGTKKTALDFDYPVINSNADALVAYVDAKLNFVDREKTKRKEPEDGVQYALNLAKEFKKSVRIVCETLPAWDKEDSLVGDVIIQERDLSCQFLLIICRCLESGPDKADGRIDSPVLSLWDKLLFTRDFHAKYSGKSYRDNFPELFASCLANREQITNSIKKYLTDGFRHWKDTKGLQSIVVAYLNEHKATILNHGFHWYKAKMIYAIYRYEKSIGADIRAVMKGTISVEHILPQGWHWIKDEDEELKKLDEAAWDSFSKEIDGCINGIGNLLLITPSENTSVGNQHPAKKEYKEYCAGGTYKEHGQNLDKWRSSKEWPILIRKRGEAIFQFMLDTLIENPKAS